MIPDLRGALVRARWIARSAGIGLRTTPMTSLAALLTIAVTLVLSAAFALLLRNLHGVVERLGEDVRVTAWLTTDVDDARAREMAASLAETPGVASVEYISRDEARRRFSADGADHATMIEALEENPLPASLELVIAPAARSTAGVAAVVDAVQTTPGVDDVAHEQEWIDGYARALSLLRAVGVVLGSVLAAATLLIVANTVRLALHARQREIEILSLVGASRSFIVMPHVLEGVLQGVAGGALAWLVLAALFRVFEPSLAAGFESLVGPMPLRFLTPGEALALSGAGAALGALGAGLSLVAGWRE